MRSRKTKLLTILGVMTATAIVAGCGDGGRKGAAPSPVAESVSTEAVTPQASIIVPVPEPQIVDKITAKAAWKDGVASFDARDFTAASKKLKTAVAGAPESSYRRYLLGLSLFKSGDLEGAEASLVESVKLDASRTRGWINLARVRNERGDRTGALEAADQALGLDPQDADAMHQKGRALMELGRGDEALVTLTMARGLDGTNGYIANTLGLLLIHQGKPAEAISPLESAKAGLPHVAYVRNNLGVAYERTGRIGDAKIEYRAAVLAGDAGGKAAQSLARLGATGTTEPAETAVTTASTNPQQ